MNLSREETARLIAHTIQVVQAERAHQRQQDIEIIAKAAHDVAQGTVSENELATVCMARIEAQQDYTMEHALAMTLDTGGA